MLKIEEAVDGVLAAMRMQGFLESTLEHLKWSVYKYLLGVFMREVLKIAV